MLYTIYIYGIYVLYITIRSHENTMKEAKKYILCL